MMLILAFTIQIFQVHNEIRRCWSKRRQNDNMFTRTFTLSSYRKGSSMSHSTNAHPRQTQRIKLDCPPIKETDSNEDYPLTKETCEINNATVSNGGFKQIKYSDCERSEQHCPLMK